MKQIILISGLLPLFTLSAMAWEFPPIPNLPHIPIPHINFVCTVYASNGYAFNGTGWSAEAAAEDARAACTRWYGSDACTAEAQNCHPYSVGG